MTRHRDHATDAATDNPVVDSVLSGPTLSRRKALKAGGAAVLAASFVNDDIGLAQSDPPALPFVPVNVVDIKTTINGQSLALNVDARTSLLDLLRERLALTGAKKGCDHGQCGHAQYMLTESALRPA
jgi:xanthine dehydrogenase YagT iron-sulfur-binding subunit